MTGMEMAAVAPQAATTVNPSLESNSVSRGRDDKQFFRQLRIASSEREKRLQGKVGSAAAQEATPAKLELVKNNGEQERLELLLLEEMAGNPRARERGEKEMDFFPASTSLFIADTAELSLKAEAEETLLTEAGADLSKSLEAEKGLNQLRPESEKADIFQDKHPRTPAEKGYPETAPSEQRESEGESRGAPKLAMNLAGQASSLEKPLGQIEQIGQIEQLLAAGRDKSAGIPVQDGSLLYPNEQEDEPGLNPERTGKVPTIPAGEKQAQPEQAGREIAGKEPAFNERLSSGTEEAKNSSSKMEMQPNLSPKDAHTALTNLLTGEQGKTGYDPATLAVMLNRAKEAGAKQSAGEAAGQQDNLPEGEEKTGDKTEQSARSVKGETSPPRFPEAAEPPANKEEGKSLPGFRSEGNWEDKNEQSARAVKGEASPSRFPEAESRFHSGSNAEKNHSPKADIAGQEVAETSESKEEGKSLPGFRSESNWADNSLRHSAKPLPGKGWEDPEKFMEQLVKKAELMIKQNVTEMRIKLHPEFLGRMTIKLLWEDGMLTARFIAESHQVKHLLENNLNSLRQNLEAQGIRVEKTEVNVQLNNGGLFDGSEGSRQDLWEQPRFSMQYNAEEAGSEAYQLSSAEDGPEAGLIEASNEYGINPDGSMNFLV